MRAQQNREVLIRRRRRAAGFQLEQEASKRDGVSLMLGRSQPEIGRSTNTKGGRSICRPFEADLSGSAHFRLVIAVRSAESLATPTALHQLEPKPPGLIAVMLAGLKLVVL